MIIFDKSEYFIIGTGGIKTEGMLKDAFWNMSFKAYILAMYRAVMTLLWIMRGPEGLKGHY